MNFYMFWFVQHYLHILFQHKNQQVNLQLLVLYFKQKLPELKLLNEKKKFIYPQKKNNLYTLLIIIILL